MHLMSELWRSSVVAGLLAAATVLTHLGARLPKQAVQACCRASGGAEHVHWALAALSDSWCCSSQWGALSRHADFLHRRSTEPCCPCRLVLQKLEVALSVDAMVTATRAYLERSLRELFAKGPAGAAPAEDGPDSLQGQLATLGSWHSWLLGHLRHFKVGEVK